MQPLTSIIEVSACNALRSPGELGDLSTSAKMSLPVTFYAPKCARSREERKTDIWKSKRAIRKVFLQQSEQI